MGGAPGIVCRGTGARGCVCRGTCVGLAAEMVTDSGAVSAALLPLPLPGAAGNEAALVARQAPSPAEAGGALGSGRTRSPRPDPASERRLGV